MKLNEGYPNYPTDEAISTPHSNVECDDGKLYDNLHHRNVFMASTADAPYPDNDERKLEKIEKYKIIIRHGLSPAHNTPRHPAHRTIIKSDNYFPLFWYFFSTRIRNPHFHAWKMSLRLFRRFNVDVELFGLRWCWAEDDEWSILFVEVLQVTHLSALIQRTPVEMF